MHPAPMTFLAPGPAPANVMDWVTTQLVARGWATQDDPQAAQSLPSSFEMECYTPEPAEAPAGDAGATPPARETEMDRLLAETSKHLRQIGRVNILVAGQTGVAGA